MLFGTGEKVHIQFRPRFVGDVRMRHLVGVIEAESGAAIRVRGLLYLFDPDRKAFVRTQGVRDEVVAVGDANLTITILPEEAPLGRLELIVDDHGMRLLTDRRGFELPLSIRGKGD